MAQNIAVIYGMFHEKEMETMLKATKQAAKKLGLSIKKIVAVPGSMEVPLALHRALARPDIAGAVVLGIIERGETKHGMVMGHTVIQSVIDQQIQTGKPVGVGILGPEILPSQIPSRLTGYAEAAVNACHHMMNLDL